MSAKKLLAIAVASVVLIGGAAAVGAAAPVDQANENATADVDANASDHLDEEMPDGDETPGDGMADDGDEPDVSAPVEAPVDESEMDDDAGPGNAPGADGVGPDDGLPSPVPDHVHTIHDTIDSFLDGSVGDLGDALSDLLGGDDDAAQDADGDRPEQS